jgi:hypothetical protein
MRLGPMNRTVDLRRKDRGWNGLISKRSRS